MKHFIIYYSLTYTIGMIRSSRMRWAGHAACVRAKKKNAHTYVVHEHEGANSEYLKYDGTVWNGFIWVKIKTTGRHLSTCY